MHKNLKKVTRESEKRSDFYLDLQKAIFGFSALRKRGGCFESFKRESAVTFF